MTKRIILIEDNEGDILITMEVLKDIGINDGITVFTDGESALQHLKKVSLKECARPDIIILDINIPRVGGMEILKAIKSNEILKKTPVIILTTSMSTTDIDQAYLHHANSYLIKSMDLFEFMDKLKITIQYWFGVVELSSS